jgi:hypothetical protein
MAITIGSGINIGPGINIGSESGSVSFALSSSDFTNSGSNGFYSVAIGGNVGFNTNYGGVGPGQALWNVYLSANNGGSAVKSAELAALWTAQGWSLTDYTARIFNVSWGSGSSSATGKVYMGLYYGDSNNTYLQMGTVDTGNNDWQTPGADIYSGPPYIELGGWLLPATFTLYTPEIASPGNWC